MADLVVPLSARWRLPIAEFALPRAAAVEVPDGIVVRHGGRVMRLEKTSGGAVWEHAFPAKTLDENVLFRAGDLVITDAKYPAKHAHAQKQAYTITAISIDDGSVAWEVPVVGRILEGMMTLAAGVLRVIALRGRVHRMIEIDPATGAAKKPIKLDKGLEQLTDTPAGLVGCTRFEGLFVLEPKGKVRLIAEPGHWAVRRRGEVLIALARGLDDQMGRLDVRDAATLELRWSAPVSERAADSDDDAFVSLLEGHVVMRSLADGRELWRHPCGEGYHRLQMVGPYVAAFGVSEGELLRRDDGRSLGRLCASGSLLVTGDTVYARDVHEIAAFERGGH